MSFGFDLMAIVDKDTVCFSCKQRRYFVLLWVMSEEVYSWLLIATDIWAKTNCEVVKMSVNVLIPLVPEHMQA